MILLLGFEEMMTKTDNFSKRETYILRSSALTVQYFCQRQQASKQEESSNGSDRTHAAVIVFLLLESFAETILRAYTRTMTVPKPWAIRIIIATS
jgi:hypothetical protein